jgi:hypothetical protein
MEAILPDKLKAILLGLLAIAFALGWLARAFPQIGWLQFFRLPRIEMSEEQRAHRRRSANRLAALEIIIAGLALPLVYVIATVMFFNDFKTIPTIIVNVWAVLCIAIGIWIFVRNR